MAGDENTSSLHETWNYHNPVKIFFGDKVSSQIAAKLKPDASFIVVCTPNGRRRIEQNTKFTDLTNSNGLIWADRVEPNPDIDNVQQQIEALRDADPRQIIAIGGGSVIDTAKALAVGLGGVKTDSLRNFLSEPDTLKSIQPLSLIVSPTTAGTGSEVTPFATLWDNKAKKKLSIAGPNIFPIAAYLDPGLTLELPESVTISTGLDAINQAFEAIWNKNANPISLQYAMRAAQAGIDSLAQLVSEPENMHARQLMMECSLFAGLAISQTRTALCHSISYPLTSYFDVPHGLACAFSMKSVFDLCASHDERRLRQTAQYMKLPDTKALRNKIEGLLHLLQAGEKLRSYLPSLEELKLLSGEMFTPGRADNCPFPVTTDIVENILETSYQQP